MFSATESAVMNYFSIQLLSILLNVCFQGTLILGLTLVLLRKVKLSHNKQHLIIVLSILSFLLIPLFFQVQGAIVNRLQQRGSYKSSSRLISFPVKHSNRSLLHFNFLEHKSGETSAKSYYESSHLHWSFWTLVIWVCGVSLGILHILIGKIALWRLIRRAKTCQNVTCQELIRTLLRQIGIKRKVHILESEDVMVPVTCGSVRPSIILPASRRWENSSADLNMAIHHEVMHIKRWDCFTQFLSRVVCTLFWFNPVVWFAFAHQKALQENACDAGVIHSGVQPADYAEMLLNVVWKLKPRLGFAGTSLSLVKTSVLEQRIVNILTIQQGEKSGRVKKLMMLIGLLGLVFVILCTPGFSLYDEESNLSILKTTLQQQSGYRYEEVPYFLKFQHKGLPVAWPILNGKGNHTHRKEEEDHRYWGKLSPATYWIDIYWYCSLPIVAPETGHVVEVNERDGDLSIKLAHNHQYYTLYMNVERAFVTVGQHIKKGEVIGYMGRWLNDNQYKLRYSILKEDRFLNPDDLLYLWGPRLYFDESQKT